MSDEKPIIYSNVPECLPGACFHGEVWAQCPHCKCGIEMYGMLGKALAKEGFFVVYRCPECGKLFKERVSY